MGITNEGLVTLTFSQDMEIINDLELIKSETVTDQSGVTKPFFETDVLPGDNSSEEYLQYSWRATKMTKRVL